MTEEYDPKKMEQLGWDLFCAWERQQAYNALLPTHTREQWAQIYLTGLASEIGEVLREINWKVHRASGDPVEMTGLAVELADLTKYTMCLWQLFGFSEHEMLDWVHFKNDVMAFRHRQEFSPPITDSNVVVLDLDGVVADWRSGFIYWLQEHGLLKEPVQDPERTLSVDIDLGLSYAEYARWKKEFERDGGFLKLPAFLKNVRLVREWRDQTPQAQLVVTTARTTAIPRVWYDTYRWLVEQDILPDRMYFTADGRIAITLDLVMNNKEVVLIDDNPDIHLRTSHNNLRMLVPTRGYNWAIVPDLPRLHKTADLYQLWKDFPEVMPGGKS